MISLSYGSIRADFFELQAADTKEVMIFLIVGSGRLWLDLAALSVSRW